MQLYLHIFRNNPSYLGSSVPSTSPDNDIFIYLSKLYASNHLFMANGSNCDDKFRGGITNGADWYNVRGMILYT